MYILSDFIITPDSSYREALRKINRNLKGFLIVTDKGRVVLGTLTDGDIRRFIVSGGNIDQVISLNAIYSSNCVLLDISGTLFDAVELFKDEKTNFLPIVDKAKVLLGLITKAQFKTLMLRGEYPVLGFDFLNVDESLTDHELFLRPWGIYKTTILQDSYQGKVLHLFPDSAISLQYHRRREEYWVVVSGSGFAQIGESAIPLNTGSRVFIPKYCLHRLTNKSLTDPLIVSEIQIGDYLGEDDIYRVEDLYGRELAKADISEESIFSQSYLEANECSKAASSTLSRCNLANVRLFLTDCDGCLTDGGMYYSGEGEFSKRFDTRDGMGLKLLGEAGIKTGVITGEDSPSVLQRVKKLGVDIYRPGCVNKLQAIQEISESTGFPFDSIVYVGDDINDRCLIGEVGLFCAPADAHDQIRRQADYVTNRAGGHGAVREIADMILECCFAKNELTQLHGTRGV